MSQSSIRGKGKFHNFFHWLSGLRGCHSINLRLCLTPWRGLMGLIWKVDECFNKFSYLCHNGPRNIVPSAVLRVLPLTQDRALENRDIYTISSPSHKRAHAMTTYSYTFSSNSHKRAQEMTTNTFSMCFSHSKKRAHENDNIYLFLPFTLESPCKWRQIPFLPTHTRKPMKWQHIPFPPTQTREPMK